MSAIFTVTALPLGLLIVITGIVGILGSAGSAISALFGGLAVILPTVVFTGLAFRHAGARNARSIVRSFYLGESLKLVLTAGLLVCVFVWVDPLVPGAVFGSFIAMQLACGVSATRLKKALPNRRQ